MRRKGIMLCYPFEEKRLFKWEPPYLIQPKLDGERCRAIFSHEGHSPVTLLSSEENRILSVPHIEKALEGLNLPDGTELDGELYVHGMNFEDIFSIVSRTKNIHPDYLTMQYHIFDMVSEGPQMARLTEILELEMHLTLSSPLRTVSTVPAGDFNQVMEAYDGFIGRGYEGMIVRHKDAPYIRRRSIYMMKFKPKKSDIYRIVGWKEEVSIKGVPKGRMGALICVSASSVNKFSVGSGMTERKREELWKVRDLLAGKFCKVEYQHITSGKGVPRFPIFLKIFDVNDSEVWD